MIPTTGEPPPCSGWAPIPATASAAHVAENLAAGSGPLPDERTRRRIIEAVEA